MKTIFITAQTPWGKGEAFIFEEMLDIQRLGGDFLIIARNPPEDIFHKEGRYLIKNAIWTPLISGQMMVYFIKMLFSHRILWDTIVTIVASSRNLVIAMKNLAVFPKAVFVARTIRKMDVGHIHAHWGTTTATMAFVISKMTGIPWSFTLHRWDITENNILRQKVRSAAFVRCISQLGKGGLSKIIGNEFEGRLKMIHMGVSIPETLPPIANRGGRLAIVVPANLIDVKGHRYLIDAIGRLDPQKRERIKCRFFGDGHLKQKLVRQVKLRGLRDCIEFCGAAPHNSIMEIYEKGQADVIILPSINTNDGSHEGIPVSLMEAMAYGVLAVSTNTGGIAELLGGGAGIIVPEKDAAALGRTIGDIIDGKIDIETIRKAGMAKVDCEFNSRKNAAQLMKLITAREKQ